MRTYRVGLSRICNVEIDAKNKIEARRMVEFFLGFRDLSSESDREKYGFKIGKVDMLENDAFEAELLEESEKPWKDLARKLRKLGQDSGNAGSEVRQ